MVHHCKELFLEPSLRRVSTVLSKEKWRTGPMLEIAKLRIKLKQENRVSDVLRYEKDIRSLEERISFTCGSGPLQCMAVTSLNLLSTFFYLF